MMEKWNLPEGWNWIPIEELCELYGGSTPRRSNASYFGGDIVWITPTDLRSGGMIDLVVDSATKLTDEGLNSSSAKLLPEGTVLFSSRATIGKVAIAGLPLATNQGFANFVCSTAIDNKYLAWLLRALTEHIKQLATSTTYPEVSKRELRSFAIPVPFPGEPERSLGEQRRIVARIEALLAEVREMRKLHEEITADVDPLMRSILAETFPNVPQGNKPEWHWVSLGDLGKNVGGGTPRKSEPAYWDGEIPWVSPKDMKVKVIEDTQDHVTEIGIEQSSTKLIPERSILIVFRSGILAHSLPIAIAGRDLTINQDMKAIIPHSGFVSEYIAYALQAREQRFVTTCVKKGPTVHSIVGDKFWQEKIPIPDGTDSFTKQQQIVSYLDTLQAEIEEMTTLHAKDIQLIDEVEQAILAQAFRGEL